MDILTDNRVYNKQGRLGRSDHRFPAMGDDMLLMVQSPTTTPTLWVITAVN